MNNRSYAQFLAEEVALAGPSKLPPEALEAASQRLIDTLGVSLAGALTREARPTAGLALDEESGSARRGAIVWGWGRHAPLHRAVLANAVAAHALDYDDTNTHAGLHPGSIVIPVAMGLAEQGGVSGKEVLQAIACGYQAASILGRPTFGKFKGSGSSACGLFAGVIAAARLRKVSAEVTANALGLAGSFTSGTNEYLASGGDSKPLQHGWAAQSAMVAVALAERGAVGPRRMFEGDFGVFRAMCGLEPDDSIFTADPWQELEVTRTSIKPYPVCHSIVPVANAWLEVLRQMQAQGLDPFTDVTRITCRVPDYSARFMLIPMEAKRRPTTAHQARFSMPWCLGKLALDGRLDLKSFEPPFLAHEQVLSLAAKVDYELVPRTDVPYFIPGGVRVTMRDGMVFESFKDEHQGGPTDPLSDEQLRAKFLDAGADCGTPAQLEAVLDGVKKMSTHGAVDPVLAALAALTGAQPRTADVVQRSTTAMQ